MASLTKNPHNDCPAVLLTREDHMWPDGVHSYINKDKYRLKSGDKAKYNGNNIRDIINNLKQAYKDAGRSDLANIVEKWAVSKGI